MDLQDLRLKHHIENNSFKDAITLQEAAAICLVPEERLVELAKSGFAPHLLVDEKYYFFERTKIYKWAKRNLIQVKSGQPLQRTIRIVEHTKPDPIDLPEVLHPIYERLREVHGDPHGPCVYFLIHKHEIVYIGQSVALSRRVDSHRQDKTFDRVLYLPCLKEELNTVEAAFIRNIRPRLNLSHADCEMTETHKNNLLKLGFNNLLESPSNATAGGIT